MKPYVFFFITILIFWSCEDPIILDLPTGPERLVVDAAINWKKGSLGNEQQIILTRTAPFYANSVPPASGATVYITDELNNVFNFIEDGTTGIYKCTNFVPVINRTYTLTVIYNGETYTGTEKLYSVSSIDFVQQTNNGGFLGNQVEIKAFYTDPANEENYYMFRFLDNRNILADFDVFRDEFFNGNQIFAIYSQDNLQAGDIVNIRIHGISRQFYQFMFQVLQQTSTGNPFATIPALVRGNMINTTNPENFPLGYFRLSEMDELDYTVQ